MSHSYNYYIKYPLHDAAHNGDMKMIETLIKYHNHYPNETDYDNLTPLHVSCLSGHTECSQLLINYGAAIDAHAIEGETPLCFACSAGRVNCVKLLLDYGASVNPPLSLSSPLHEAAFSGNTECVRLLISANAKLNTLDCNFGTPLHAAVYRNNYDCIRILLLSGANVNAIRFHQTPLHLAVHLNHYECVIELLNFGANVYLLNNNDKSAIHLVKSKSGPLYDALMYAQKNPSKLKDLCRWTMIKNQLLQKLMPQIYVPQSIIEFINNGI